MVNVQSQNSAPLQDPWGSSGVGFFVAFHMGRITWYVVTCAERSSLSQVFSHFSVLLHVRPPPLSGGCVTVNGATYAGTKGTLVSTALDLDAGLPGDKALPWAQGH